MHRIHYYFLLEESVISEGSEFCKGRMCNFISLQQYIIVKVTGLFGQYNRPVIACNIWVCSKLNNRIATGGCAE